MDVKDDTCVHKSKCVPFHEGGVCIADVGCDAALIKEQSKVKVVVHEDDFFGLVHGCDVLGSTSLRSEKKHRQNNQACLENT